MGRRGRARAFKRNANYGWAAWVSDFELLTSGVVSSEIIVAGESDIEVRSVGHTHANLKRIVGDITWWPLFASAAETFQDDPPSTWRSLSWFLLIVDNDDDSIYDPTSATHLSEERVLAHGNLGSGFQRYLLPTGGTSLDVHVDGVFQSQAVTTHIDVSSNRRLTSDTDVRLYLTADGSPDDEGTNFGFYRAVLRALVKFPG